MILKNNRKLIVLTVTTFILCSVVSAQKIRYRSADDVWGQRYSAQASTTDALRRPLAVDAVDAAPTVGVHRWNQIAINASGLDHMPVAPGENRIFGQQLGPGRAARAVAIVHIAIFDAVNAIAGGFQSYTGIPRASSGTSMNAAIAQAAHDTLAALFPSQKPSFDELLAEDLSQIPDGLGKTNGITLGRLEAKTILARRVGDGSQFAELLVGI